MDRGAWGATVHRPQGHKRDGHDLVTWQQQKHRYQPGPATGSLQRMVVLQDWALSFVESDFICVDSIKIEFEGFPGGSDSK